MQWHSEHNKRIMPWTKERDTYKIWLSEILLQQTRVDQALGYYKNFLLHYPSLDSLALAEDEAVFKVWEGLGYYSRCKNLLATARKIYFELGGKFPDTYEDILLLKGVGPYTAAAIASFAFGLPHAVVDGNVYRVLSRYFGEAVPVDSSVGKKRFAVLANELIDQEDPAAYNQAIMDFGATVCKPQVALCSECLLQKHCEAYKNGLVNKLPVKEKVLKKKNRFFTYFIFKVDGKTLVNKRVGKDIWQSLFEFYLYESPRMLEWSEQQIADWLSEQFGLKKYSVEQVSAVYHQQLTHQHIAAKFVTIILPKVPEALGHFTACDADALGQIAFPQIINQYLQQGAAAMDAEKK